VISLLPFVLDASVIGKLALDEPGAPAARAWNLENAGEAMHAPTLAYSEVGRILQKAKRGASIKALAAMHERVFEDIQLVEPRWADGPEVWGMADGLSFYDAEYVRLAQRLGGVLVTADRKMAERARKQGVQVKEF